MPWKQTYEPAPKDMSLVVLKELPEGVTEHQELFSRIKTAAGKPSAEGWPHYYFCRYCGGWIEGYPNEYRVNTMDSYRLSGRRGTESHCIRCGEQIGFSGMVS